MTQVSQQEADTALTLFKGLLRHANTRAKVVAAARSDGTLDGLTVAQLIKIREALFDQPTYFDSYIEHEAPAVCLDAPEIVAAWRDHHVKERFLIVRHGSRHSVFLGSGPKAYAVLGLNSSIEEVVPDPPRLVETVLLPFRGRIIWDGLAAGFPVTFGPGARKGFEDSYRQAKAQFGLISSLPLLPARGGTPAAEDRARRLVALLGTERSRQQHLDVILELRRSDIELEVLYHQTLGKAHARLYGRRLREAGISTGWFALYQGLVIASATSRAELEPRVRDLLPSPAHRFPYLFQLRDR